MLPLSDPRVSPTRADLKGLCPWLIVLGELEIPHDDIVAFAAKLEAAGVDTKLYVAPTMPHNHPAFAAMHPAGAASMTAIVEYARATVG